MVALKRAVFCTFCIFCVFFFFVARNKRGDVRQPLTVNSDSYIKVEKWDKRPVFVACLSSVSSVALLSLLLKSD